MEKRDNEIFMQSPDLTIELKKGVKVFFYSKFFFTVEEKKGPI